VINSINQSKEEIIQRYQEYLACFNAKDFKGLKNYLAEDMYFYRGRIPPLIGREAFFKFYEKVWQHLEEHITINSIDVFDRNIIVNVTNHLHIFKDWPDGPFGPYKKGLEKEVSGYVVYAFNHGTIAIIIDND
jgi:ketosteroid isomerase-like protein